MNSVKAKPHAGGRGASNHASARESVGGLDDNALPGLPALPPISAHTVLRNTRRRRKAKGRAETGIHFGLPHAVMDSPNYRALHAHAVKLLNDLGRQFRGYNNGDMSAAWRLMQPRGWKSRDTLARALAELLHFGMIEKTRQGGLNRCSLYALTWHKIDECKGKLDVAPSRVASGLWKTPMSPLPARDRKKQNASTAGVPARHGNRASSPRIVQLSARRAG